MCHELCSEVSVGTLPLTSDTGYMNGELFMQWLQHCQNHVKATEADSAVVSGNQIFHGSLRAICSAEVIT